MTIEDIANILENVNTSTLHISVTDTKSKGNVKVDKVALLGTQKYAIFGKATHKDASGAEYANTCMII